MHTQPVAIVTGASRGIGRAIALALLERKYTVVVNYRRDAAAAADVVALAAERGQTAIAIQADVSIVYDRARLLSETLERFGRLNALVNNAGIAPPTRDDLLRLTEADWDLVMATNLKAPFFLSQAASREMLALVGANAIERGTIVNISSVSAFTASVDRAEYCVSKAGLSMVTQLFAALLAEAGIAVFEVCPGVIATDMTAPVEAKYDRLIAEGLAPLRRWGQPEDVGAAVAALCTGDFPYCTGQQVHIDGGMHIRRL
jgi:3-oxoacyl-[acyl-carrier protein] reductase